MIKKTVGCNAENTFNGFSILAKCILLMYQNFEGNFGVYFH